jgi:glycosyltransferase involved in cell wall biosynthesis
MTHYVLDGRTATPHFPGIGRYVDNLARALVSLLAEEEQLVLLFDPAHSPSLPNQPHVENTVVPISPFSIHQQWAIPRLLRRLKADLYHSPYYLMPYRPGRPTMLTVYDLIPLLFPHHVSTQARLLFRWTMTLALRAADRVIAISSATRDDLLAHFSLSAERVLVIPLAADPAFCPRPPTEVEALRQKRRLPDPYILYLGSNKPHKNLSRLVEAWSHITQYATHTALVVAGAWDPRYPQSRQRAEALGLGDTIHFLGPVPEDDLPALYAGALAFVFPSLYEGFGLPVLEAMACGTPVACSNTSSLPEIVGDAALTFDPTSADAIAGALTCLLADADLRADRRKRGLRQAATFSWERTAQQTLALYRRVAA